MLSKRRQRKGFIFSDEHNNTFDENKPRRELRKVCKKEGLREVGFHLLRHSFASHLAMGGVPLKVIQELLGHKEIKTTLRYAHLSPSTQREAISVLGRSSHNENFGQQAVNTYTNLTKIGELSDYDKAIFLAKNKTKTAPGGHCSVWSG